MARWTFKASSLLLMLALPLTALFTGGAQLVPFLSMPLIVLGGPMLLDLRRNDGPGTEGEDDSDSDDGPGGNRRPDHGPMIPSGPRGDLPLEFSTPGSWRQRGHGPQYTVDPAGRRQPHRPPVRTPHRVPAGPHHR